jgi:tRNA threonylcarbamoyladenosine modification (KEOPS) complex  Pcc1 subunit
MRASIEIKREFSDALSAERVMKALLPDNKGVPKGTKIKMRTDGSDLVIEVSSSDELPSFLRTVDDILLCLQVAEGALLSSR